MKSKAIGFIFEFEKISVLVITQSLVISLVSTKPNKKRFFGIINQAANCYPFKRKNYTGIRIIQIFGK